MAGSLEFGNAMEQCAKIGQYSDVMQWRLGSVKEQKLKPLPCWLSDTLISGKSGCPTNGLSLATFSMNVFLNPKGSALWLFINQMHKLKVRTKNCCHYLIPYHERRSSLLKAVGYSAPRKAVWVTHSNVEQDRSEQNQRDSQARHLDSDKLGFLPKICVWSWFTVPTEYHGPAFLRSDCGRNPLHIYTPSSYSLYRLTTEQQKLLRGLVKEGKKGWSMEQLNTNRV